MGSVTRRRDRGWPGKMPCVHSVVHRSFASNCVTLGSPLTIPSLSFLSGNLRIPPPHRFMAQSDAAHWPHQECSLHPPPRPKPP